MTRAWLGGLVLLCASPAWADANIPAFQREVSAPFDATTGSVTWTFPTPFQHTPTCWPSITSPNTNYSFDYPTTSSASTTSVTVNVVAHLNTLGVSSLTLPISLPLAVSPPAGTTITLSCVGDLP